MKVQKYNILQFLRSHYPEFLGIRRRLQGIKVTRLTRYRLKESEIQICEADASQKERIITPYLTKWEKYLKATVSEMNLMVEKSPLFAGRDANCIKTDMLFCKLAYGFLPSEYVGFGLVNKTSEERRLFCSDTDTYIF